MHNHMHNNDMHNHDMHNTHMHNNHMHDNHIHNNHMQNNYMKIIIFITQNHTKNIIIIKKHLNKHHNHQKIIKQKQSS